MAEEVGVLTLLLLLLAGDVGEARDNAGRVLRPLGGRPGGDRPGGGGDGAFRPSISAASFSSEALRSATRSAMRASRSVSSSSWRDAEENMIICQGLRYSMFSKGRLIVHDLGCFLSFKHF